MEICKICGRPVTTGVVVHAECLCGSRATEEMKNLVEMLHRLSIERRPEACLGCGFEHGCSVHGCAVIKRAADTIDPETLPIVRELREKLAECEPVHAHWIDDSGEGDAAVCSE